MQAYLSRTRALRLQYWTLWQAEHAAFTLLGSGDRFTARRERVAERLREAAEGGPGQVEAQSFDHLEPADFQARFLRPQVPVVVRGAAREWRCCQKWTMDWFRAHYGDETVRHLQIGPGESPRKGTGRDVTFAEVIDDQTGSLYSRFSGLMMRRTELLDDVDCDWLRTMRARKKGFENYGLFLGGTGTATGLHSSIAPNLFVQVSGRKRWYIYPAAVAPAFQPVVKGSPYFYSLVDAANPEAHPFLRGLPGWTALLEPGDVLYVPPFAWHQVNNLTPTIAFGYRWTRVPDALKASVTQTLLAATATNPRPGKAFGHLELPELLDAHDY